MYGINNNTYLLENSELTYTYYELDIEIHSLKKLNDNIENSLLNTIEELKKAIKENKTYIYLADEKDLQSDYVDQIYFNDIASIKNMKRQQRYAVTLIAFSFFESKLKEICDIIALKTNIKTPTQKQKNENDLTIYWNYLTNKQNLELTNIMDSFYFINCQKFVRDKIAHKNGIYKPKDESPNYKFLKTNDSEATKLGDDYCIEILNKKYTENLLLKMDKVLKGVIITFDKTNKQKNEY